MPYTPSFFQIVVARTSSIMLNESGESGHSFLVLDFKINAFSFPLLTIMLTVGVSHMAFIMLRYVPSIPTLLRVFIINRCWIFSNAFLHLLIWSYDFYFYVVYHVNWFANIPILYHRNKSHWIMMHYLFSLLLDLDC